MKKQILFFSEIPPSDRNAIHIWFGKADLPHKQLLSRFIGQYLGAPPLELAISPSGKPYLPDSPLHFNLSDSEDWLAIAFSWKSPVGIDIETIRPIEAMDALIRDCFAKREQAYIKEKNTLIRFWQIWNRKEACLKALGLGLQDNMAQWDCCGNGWIRVNKVWVRSVSIKNHLCRAQEGFGNLERGISGAVAFLE